MASHFVDKFYPFKIDIHKSELVFLIADCSVACQLIDEVVSLIPVRHGGLYSAGFYFLNDVIQLVDAVSQFVDLVYGVCHLLIQVGLIALQIAV